MSKTGQGVWATALVEVLDTAKAVLCWANDHEIKPTINLGDLARMVIERHDQIKQNSSEGFAE